MIVMIVGLDQVLWRPVVVWAQRFRVEETAGRRTPRSWFLDLLRRSRLRRRRGGVAPAAGNGATPAARRGRTGAGDVRSRAGAHAAGPALAARSPSCCWRCAGLWRRATRHLLLRPAGRARGHGLLGAGALTLARVLSSTALGTLWAVPVGLAIGLSPRLSRLLQPVVQVVASFPAPMLFPAVDRAAAPAPASASAGAASC